MRNRKKSGNRDLPLERMMANDVFLLVLVILISNVLYVFWLWIFYGGYLDIWNWEIWMALMIMNLIGLSTLSLTVKRHLLSLVCLV